MARRMIIWLLLAIVLVIFALQNVESISLKFFFWELTNVPLPILILLSFLIGIIIMALFSWPRTYKLRKSIKNLNKRIEELEEELARFSRDNEDDKGNLGPRLEGDSDAKLFDDED